MQGLTDEVRSELLHSLLRERGVHFNPSRMGWQKVSCYGSGHRYGDRNPSASINLSTGYYQCFACGLKGDAVALVMQESGLDFKAALATLGVGDMKKVEVPEWI